MDLNLFYEEILLLCFCSKVVHCQFLIFIIYYFYVATSDLMDPISVIKAEVLQYITLPIELIQLICKEIN